MNRSALCLVALSLVVSPLACKKKTEDATGKAKSGAKEEEASDDDKKKKKKGDNADEPGDDKAATKGCKPPKSYETNHEIDADWTIPEDCKVKLSDHLTIVKGATVKVEPGARLSFASNKYLWINNGKLVAKGTDEKPIVFTSQNSSPSAGDWEGLIYDRDASGGNVLDHVRVEYAGHEGGYSRGGITIYGDMGGGRLSITNSAIEHNGQCGISNDHQISRFGKVEGNTFKENGGASLLVHPDVLGSVSANKFEEPIKVKHGEVTKSATWPKAPAILMEDHVSINGKGAAAILTLADKQTLKFAPTKYLWIGGGDGGGIVGKGVTFTSANASPAEGDWDGLVIDAKTSGSLLEDCVIEYAGHEGGYAHAAVTFYGKPMSQLKGFKMKNCTFKHNHKGAFFTNGDKDCGDLGHDNKSEGQPVCVTSDH